MPITQSWSSTSPPRADAAPRSEEDSSAGSHHESRSRDGRAVGRHIVDRALDYAALARGGLTAAQIARRRKKSKGYVSIVLRLGMALRSMGGEEIAVFRSERITWKLAQRVVRAGVSDAEVRRQLRYAVGGFSTHNIDRRKLRTHRAGRMGNSEAPRVAGEDAGLAQRVPESGAYVWRWDAAWAARDPVGYVDAYRAHLTSLHRAMRTRFGELAASRASAAAGAPIPMVGQSLRQITAMLARERAETSAAARSALAPGDREALASLAALDALLVGAQARNAAGATTGTSADSGAGEEPEFE